MRIVGNDLALSGVSGADHDLDEQAFAGASLVCRQDVGEAGHALDRVEEAVVARRPGVGFVAAHHAGPLLAAHRAGA